MTRRSLRDVLTILALGYVLLALVACTGRYHEDNGPNGNRIVTWGPPWSVCQPQAK